MNLNALKSILDIKKRKNLYNEILDSLRELKAVKYFKYIEFETSEGIVPFVYVAKEFDINRINSVKVFVGAQHNEYNGLFGILEFLNLLETEKLNSSEILQDNQILIFAPLMNPYGFLNPTTENKTGYYLKNGSNLNRFWRRTFVTEYEKLREDLNGFPIPEIATIFKNLLKEYWERNEIAIYFIDFHETSLLEKFPKELSLNLKNESYTYRFDHWLKEGIIANVIKLYNIPYYEKPLFRKCNPSADHTHLNLSIQQIDLVFEKLLDYLSKNQGKLPFYFCYNQKSKEYCEKLANQVYNKLEDKLYDTYYVSFDHYFHDHGCFVKMSDSTTREKVYSIELEAIKQFFNIFEEIEKSEMDADYFEKKLNSINVSIELVVETIIEMIKLF